MANNETLAIGIIGGKGQLGGWCSDIFQKRGYPLLIADRDTELSNLELVEQASIVVVSVPIGVTGDVLREIQGALRSDQLVVDLTSVKTLPKLRYSHFTRCSLRVSPPRPDRPVSRVE
jgi:chorismate mutase/prephenate dehydrogenase